MAYVIAEPCIKCKYTRCVTVCPVNCFHEGALSLAIDPDVCIDCAACVPECPVEAIYAAEDLPEAWREYIALNRTYAPQWPSITATQDALPTAEEFKDVRGKRLLFDPRPAPRGLGL